jgi:hypothetical protein
MLTRRSVLLAKIETVYGTDPVPVAGDAVLCIDPVVRVDGELLDRRFVKQNLSPLTPILGAKSVEVTFAAELKGSGAAGTAPEIGPLLRACGMSETIVASTSVAYAPVSTAFESCTIYVYYDGMLHKVCGCRGTVDVDLAAGQYGLLNFRFMGLFQIPVDQAIVSGTFDATKPVAVAGLGMTIGAYAAIFERLQLALNNDLTALKDANTAAVIRQIVITGRRSAGSFNPETVLEATNDFWGDWNSRLEMALTALVGSVAGNKVQIDAPKVSYNQIAWGDRDGQRIYDIPFTCAGNAGDDELVLTFK